jgi:hypothetical protein
MNASESPQDLNRVALANLRALVAEDDQLIPEWKTKLSDLIGDEVPEDISPLEGLLPVEADNAPEEA